MTGRESLGELSAARNMGAYIGASAELIDRRRRRSGAFLSPNGRSMNSIQLAGHVLFKSLHYNYTHSQLSRNKQTNSAHFHLAISVHC